MPHKINDTDQKPRHKALLLAVAALGYPFRQGRCKENHRMLSRACLSVLVLCCCSTTLLGKPAEPGRGVAPSQCSTPEANPVVEIVRSGPFSGITADGYARTHYDDFIGTISNANFYRSWDETCGSYKVPVRIVAPKAASCGAGRLAHLGLIELIHPNFIGYASPEDFEGTIHAWNDPVYDPLLDHGFHEAWANLRVPFLFGDPDEHGGGGAVYVGFQANNFNGELDYIASLPENQSLGLHLQRPQDYAVLYRDVSQWLRQAKTQSNFVNAGGRDICPISDVVGFGYSYTSLRLKAVTAEGLNSAWGKADPIFPRGRVMDGMLLGGFFGSSRVYGGRCRPLTASDFMSLNCDGPDHIGEGPMVLVESETDVQFLAASTSTRPDPPGSPRELDHYRVHEINAASHLDATYFPYGPFLEFFGFDPSATRQNPLDRSPVFRADLINLLDKVRNDTPLPSSNYMKVHGAPKSSFELGVILLDPSTGNGFGGIMLPQAAAPLGLYRGVDCHSAFSFDFDITNAYHYARPPLGSGDLNTNRANFVLESSAQFPAGLICAGGGIEGLMTPYSVVDDALGTRYCQSLYPTRQAYSERVIAAADALIARRLLLPAEREALIAAAEAQADLYPECVPPRN
jgi:hypothetical protein